MAAMHIVPLFSQPSHWLRSWSTCSLLFIALSTQAQDFLFQGWYWNYPFSVAGRRYMRHTELQVPEVADAGFTYWWLPPLSVSSGGFSTNGYDVKDYYDLGQFTNTRWGTRSQLNSMVSTLNSYGIRPVADMIYNHRDGGHPEDNPAVEGWIENMTAAKITAGDQPFPSDRYRCILPLGGATGNGAGTYYFKISSASGDSRFWGRPYTLNMWTNRKGMVSGAAQLNENEPNGGGDCGQPHDTTAIGRSLLANIDAAGCRTDEFAVNIRASDFNAAGDTLYITLANGGGLDNQCDHRIYGIWNAAIGQDVQSQLRFQTYTNFRNLPSGRGGMDWQDFKPNGNPTQLAGDQDAMLFFYDLDQTRQATRDSLYEWTRWMWQNAGMRGFRIDAVKHFPSWFIGDLLDYLHQRNINPGLVVGESFDYNPWALKGWLDAVRNSMDPATRSAIQIRIFDFSLRNIISQACALNTDVRNCYSGSVVGATSESGAHVVTFVNNHDFRPGEPAGPIVDGADLGYAYILTNNQIGIPSVYYTDFYNPSLRWKIHALIQVHKRYIFGAPIIEYLNSPATELLFPATYTSGYKENTLIYQIRGGFSGRDVVVAINFAQVPLQLNQTLSNLSLGVGDTLTDILEATSNPFLIVQAGHRINISLPARSFAVWVKGDLRNQTIPMDSTIATVAVPEAVPTADDLLESTLQVIPNPFRSVCTLQFESERTARANLFLYDLTGRLAHRQTIDVATGMNRVEVAPQATQGVYMLHLHTDTGHQYSRKVVLQH